MAVRLVRKTWWVDFWFNNTRHRKRSPENSRTGALAYEAVLRQKMARGESLERVAHDKEKQQTFEKFAARWMEEYVVPNNKHSEQRTKRYIMNGSLIPFFGKLPIQNIGTQHIEKYKAHEIKSGISSKTLKNRLTVLSTCLKTAYEWLGVETKPPTIKWPKCPPPETDYLSPDECELLLSRTDGIVRELILTALRTGMRQGELKGLQWSSINWGNRSIAVRHSRDDREKILVSPKSNRERHIPMDIDVYEALYRRKRNTGYVFLDSDKEPFDYHRMERRLTKACKEAGLRKIGWHTLRHTFATHLAMRGVPLNTVQVLLGHSTIITTMRYAHVAPSTLRSAIAILSPRTAQNANFGQPVVNEWQQSNLAEIMANMVVPENA